MRARAFAPSSIGNVGPGLDVLGAAVTGAGDIVVAEWTNTPGIELRDAGHPDLPRDPARHTSTIAAAAVVRAAVARGIDTGGRGIALAVTKGLPLSAGQGGSASSAVAGAAAANALLGAPLDATALMAAALVAEERVAGRHLDNIAPSVLGGVVLTRSLDPIDVLRLPLPSGIWIALVHPHQLLRTADARAVLPAAVPREVALHQVAHVAMMVAALYEGDVRRFGQAIDDRIAEPARAALLPGFADAKRAALDTGAFGASISGSGPTIFAVCDDEGVAARVVGAMRDAYRSRGVATDGRVAQIDGEGVRVETEQGDER